MKEDQKSVIPEHYTEGIDPALFTKTENALKPEQLSFLLQKTHTRYTYKRKAKGGGQWTYVSVGYIEKVLNIVFGWDWSFQIVEVFKYLDARQIVVHGRLTVAFPNGKTVTKDQFGRCDIKFYRDPKKGPLDIGNDMKGAASDALKKCASLLGIAADIYHPREFKQQKVNLEHDNQNFAEDDVEMEEINNVLNTFTKPEQVTELYNQNKDLHQFQSFVNACNKRKQQLIHEKKSE